jgi:carboxypeptidase Taq
MKEKLLKTLRERLSEVTYLGSISSVLHWDQEVHMPEKGAKHRAIAISHLSTIIHNKFVQIDKDGTLTKLKKLLDEKKLKGADSVIVHETWRSFERERKLPENFVRELAQVTSEAQGIWAEARKNDDFKAFLPWLKKIVALKQKEAELIGYEDSPYDALLDAYEPGMTTKEVARVLDDVKDFLVPFLQRIRGSRTKADRKMFAGTFPIDKQAAFDKQLAQELGFDLRAGRIDKSTHPFASGFNPGDVRITTRFNEHDLFESIGATIHETGHALYEQGLPHEAFGTPLSEAVSLGIHESQSRLWENMIGKGLPFWMHFYPKLQKEFPVPFKKISLPDFYRAHNSVGSSLIRIEADEVTYNLHIIIRFEIEKEMIEGTIDLADLPAIWSSKVQKYLGIKVPSDRLGVLQDVHWSTGGIGYFPTYTLGNLYAAQLYAEMSKQIPDLEQRIAKGDFAVVREWLRANVHMHGKTYTAQELIKRVTGEYLNGRYFNDYLEKKFAPLYGLKPEKRKN